MLIMEDGFLVIHPESIAKQQASESLPSKPTNQKKDKEEEGIMKEGAKYEEAL